MEINEIQVDYKKSKTEIEDEKITSSESAFKLFRDYATEINFCESSYVLFLDTRNRPLGIKQISKGGKKGTIVDPKIVFSIALKVGASGIILCHNHPSGELIPSQQDKSLTQKIKKGGDVLDIQVFDHLIISENDYYSFADFGEL